MIALGSTYAAVISNDDELAGEIEAVGKETGELVWRLPLHAEYKALMKGTVADLTNAAAKRKAGTLSAAGFLEEFVGDTPWAHLDIAGTAWDVGRAYTGNRRQRLRRPPAHRPRPLSRRLRRAICPHRRARRCSSAITMYSSTISLSLVRPAALFIAIRWSIEATRTW